MESSYLQWILDYFEIGIPAPYYLGFWAIATILVYCWWWTLRSNHKYKRRIHRLKHQKFTPIDSRPQPPPFHPKQTR
jgi:hypothetical protein